jgi:hypothetical protein
LHKLEPNEDAGAVARRMTKELRLTLKKHTYCPPKNLELEESIKFTSRVAR